MESIIEIEIEAMGEIVVTVKTENLQIPLIAHFTNMVEAREYIAKNIDALYCGK